MVCSSIEHRRRQYVPSQRQSLDAHLVVGHSLGGRRREAEHDADAHRARLLRQLVQRGLSLRRCAGSTHFTGQRKGLGACGVL